MARAGIPLRVPHGDSDGFSIHIDWSNELAFPFLNKTIVRKLLIISFLTIVDYYVLRNGYQDLSVLNYDSIILSL